MCKNNNPDSINEDILTCRAIKTETATIETYLKTTCPSCHATNRIAVTQIDIPKFTENQNIKLYRPTTTQKCTNCNQTIAEPNELIKPNEREKETK